MELGLASGVEEVSLSVRLLTTASRKKYWLFGSSQFFVDQVCVDKGDVNEVEEESFPALPGLA